MPFELLPLIRLEALRGEEEGINISFLEMVFHEGFYKSIPAIAAPLQKTVRSNPICPI